MRGFVRKRGPTWTAYFHLDNGRGRRQRSKGGFRSKAEAEHYLHSVIGAVSSGTYVETTSLTFATYLLEHWLPLVKHSIRPSTWLSYEQNLRLHVIPHIGATPIQELTVDQLDQLYLFLLDHGCKNKPGGLSPKTVRSIHNTIHKALRDAERKRVVSRNIARSADPPKIQLHGMKEMNTWTAPELRVFLDEMRDHWLYAAFAVAATTGMRRGEVLGMRWRDLNLQTRQLAIRQTVLTVNYEIVFGRPKTARGRRTIALDAATVQALARHRDQQLANQLIIGSRPEHDLVFARLDGRPVHPDYFSQLFDRSVVRIGLPKIRLHDLRHTYATLSLAAGVPAKVISTRLGHSTVAFTQDVYIHAMPDLETAAAEHMGNVILGGFSARPRLTPVRVVEDVEASADNDHPRLPVSAV